MSELKNYIYLDKPAKRWEDGLPLGNGRLGAMVMGRVKEEMITINEETLWYGPKRNRMNQDGKANIDRIRQLLLKGEVEEASFLAKLSLTSTPKYNNPYQPAGELRLCFMNHQKKVQKYKRILDIDNAVAHVSYEIDGVKYNREYFVSVKYNVLAIKITSDSSKITVSGNIGRKPFDEYSGIIGKNTAANWGENGVGGVRYCSGVRMDASFDDASHSVKTMGDFVYAESANEVVIYVTSATDFLHIVKNNENPYGNKVLDKVSDSNERRESLKKKIINTLDIAQAAGYDKIKAEHLEEYHKLYDSFSLMINNPVTPKLPTNELLASLKAGNLEHADYLTLLLFNYARYLMISSSYQCELPANLQGIWNGSFEPPWQSQYTININTQMNYWFVDKVNLSQCNRPLFNFIKRLAKNGRETAKELYGCEGFCAHHNTNLWATTDLEGIFDASPFWVMGGAWLSLHMYEHYLFTRDEKFLQEEALPVMKEAILFFKDYLYEDKDGTLLTGPTLSPENTYISKTGQTGALCMAPTMDSSILRQLITWYIEGTLAVGVKDGKEIEELRILKDKLPPLSLSDDGRILEWHEEYEEAEPGHRHISHMFALHPGCEITKDEPSLYEGAKKSIEHRLTNGGGHTGWSKAWLICFMARLHKGEELYENLIEFMKKCLQDNMLDLHPPFQIDGNFGVAEAILEGILQSHGGFIELLPALPKHWAAGKISGVGVRGGIKADIVWENHELVSCILTAVKPCKAEVRYQEKRCMVELLPNTPVEIKEDLFVTSI